MIDKSLHLSKEELDYSNYQIMHHFGSKFLCSSFRNQIPLVYFKSILQTSFRNTGITKTERYTMLLESVILYHTFLMCKEKTTDFTAQIVLKIVPMETAVVTKLTV